MKMPDDYHSLEYQRKYGLLAFRIHKGRGPGHVEGYVAHIINPDWDDLAGGPPPSSHRCNCFELAMIGYAEGELYHDPNENLFVLREC